MSLSIIGRLFPRSKHVERSPSLENSQAAAERISNVDAKRSARAAEQRAATEAARIATSELQRERAAYDAQPSDEAFSRVQDAEHRMRLATSALRESIRGPSAHERTMEAVERDRASAEQIEALRAFVEGYEILPPEALLELARAARHLALAIRLVRPRAIELHGHATELAKLTHEGPGMVVVTPSDYLARIVRELSEPGAPLFLAAGEVHELGARDMASVLRGILNTCAQGVETTERHRATIAAVDSDEG